MAEESPEGIVERLRYSLEDRPKWQTPFMAIIVILSEITGGVGPWGAIRPLIATALAIIPFLYLGQHFNRQHSKAFDWTALQVPLLFCLLWPLLWFWSIFDAYQTSMLSVADQYSVA